MLGWDLNRKVEKINGIFGSIEAYGNTIEEK